MAQGPWALDVLKEAGKHYFQLIRAQGVAVEAEYVCELFFLADQEVSMETAHRPSIPQASVDTLAAQGSRG